MKNNNQIRSQFCTCRDSWAVVTCEKLWHDWIIRSIFTVKRIFIRFQLWAHGLSVIWVPGHYQWTSSSNHIHGYCIKLTWFCSNFDGPKFNTLPADSCLLRKRIYLHFFCHFLTMNSQRQLKPLPLEKKDSLDSEKVNAIAVHDMVTKGVRPSVAINGIDLLLPK